MLINRQWAHPSLDKLMAVMSSFDLWLPFLLTGAVLILWLGRFKARMAIICALAVVGIGDGLISSTLKKAVNRPRPNQSETNVRVVTLQKARPQFLALFKPPAIRPSRAEHFRSAGRSFPSSHIMNNFAVAVTFFCFYRRFGWLAFLPATLVTYSRVYVGSHWPSDAAASVFLGISVGFLVVYSIAWAWHKWGNHFFPTLYTNHPNLLRANNSENLQTSF